MRAFEMTGRPMRGSVLVDGGAIADDGELSYWVEEGAAYASSLPPK